MTKAVVFFDLDGTLLNQHSALSPETALALAELKKNDILPVIATGRTEFEVIEKIPTNVINTYITMNGAFVRNNQTVIYDSQFDQQTCEALAEFTKQQNDVLAFYNEKEIFCTGHNETLYNHFSYSNASLPAIDPVGYLRKHVNMFLVLAQDKDSYYADNFPNLSFMRNTPFSMDVVNKNISKGTGVNRLKAGLSLEAVDTYCFGDGLNDFSLFQACDTQIAMANAHPELKKQADYVTKSNVENGIILGLQYYGLI
ncbi:Cof-type HAD-IIB family hydrolase [Enterococcus sp. AZ109]|uniref:Cof-type HAD-IIB family hydrolase n=1 Tax=Enterococcus sp. AZ109 TaxID=2774634 RepID=UPI003F265E28